ncbi:unnamed protein product [Moneuplotes crassus]|uniref:Uncharacterized protein n=1 Tax=Euplotes crassus TaxID=5936 RepID=A0AAD1U9N2_EUPCR|nr:unnamed protein product [Moneuplotes crassus]
METTQNQSLISTVCINKQIIKAEKFLESEESKINLQIWSTSAINMKVKKGCFNKDKLVSIKIDAMEDIQMLKKINGIPLANIYCVQIQNYTTNCKYVRSCMESISPTNLGSLAIASDILRNIHQFMPMITRSSHIIKGKVFLCNYNINEPQFKRIFAANKLKFNCPFMGCIISLPTVLDLSICLKGTKIKYLNFKRRCKNLLMHWEENPQELENFVHAISKSDLRLTLKKIKLSLNFSEKSLFQKLLRRYNLSHVIVAES